MYEVYHVLHILPHMAGIKHHFDNFILFLYDFLGLSNADAFKNVANAYKLENETHAVTWETYSNSIFRSERF